MGVFFKSPPQENGGHKTGDPVDLQQEEDPYCES